MVSERLNQDQDFDVLGDILETLRFRGSIFFRSDLAAPWGMSLSESGVPRFHIVLSGACYVGADGHESVKAEEADIIMLPNGDSHWIADQVGRELVASSRAGQACELGNPLFQEGEMTNRLMCVMVRFDDGLSHAILDPLPEMMHFFKLESAGPIWSVVNLIATEMQGQHFRDLHLQGRHGTDFGGKRLAAKLFDGCPEAMKDLRVELALLVYAGDGKNETGKRPAAALALVQAGGLEAEKAEEFLKSINATDKGEHYQKLLMGRSQQNLIVLLAAQRASKAPIHRSPVLRGAGSAPHGSYGPRWGSAHGPPAAAAFRRPARARTPERELLHVGLPDEFRLRTRSTRSARSAPVRHGAERRSLSTSSDLCHGPALDVRRCLPERPREPRSGSRGIPGPGCLASIRRVASAARIAQRAPTRRRRFRPPFSHTSFQLIARMRTSATTPTRPHRCD